MTNTPFPKTLKMLDQMETIARERMVDNDGKDYVYSRRPNIGGSCLYVHLGEGKNGADVPGCIIGTWLHEYKQVPLSALQRCEYTKASEVIAKALLPGERDELLARVANAVQDKQDTGWSWLRAVTSVRKSFMNAYVNV